MKNVLITSLVSVVFSAHLLASEGTNGPGNAIGDQRPSALFGQYPAKFLCSSDSYEPARCNVPTVSDMDEIIANYKAGAQDRLNSLERFKRQNDELKKVLMNKAIKAREELGENKFSDLYESFVKKMDSNLEKVAINAIDSRTQKIQNFSEIENLIGLNSPYLNSLIKLREIIKDPQEESYSKAILRGDFYYNSNDYENALDMLKLKVSSGHNFYFDFKGLIEMDKSCTKEIGYGRFSSKQIDLTWSILPGDDKHFDLIRDEEVLKKLLTGKNSKQITFQCKKLGNKASSKDLRATYNKKTQVVTVPYQAVKGFGLKADTINFEFKKDLIYNSDIVNLLKTEL